MVLSHRHRTHRRSSEWLPRAADRAEGFSDLFECSLFDLPNTFARQANGESGFFQRRGLRSIKSKSHAHNSDVNWVQWCSTRRILAMSSAVSSLTVA
jgi:hypothetical protein